MRKRFFMPYELSKVQRLFLTPYFGVGALINPERGDLVAGLGDTTAAIVIKQLHSKMSATESGRNLLRSKPLITEKSLDMNKLRAMPINTVGYQYAVYMDSHNFSADERSPVRFFTNPEHAYVMTRYRQVHDFWHVLSGLPPSVLGELALKWFEWHVTGLPICLFSGVLGPLKIPPHEHKLLWSVYHPWASRCASQCSDLIGVEYEKHLETDVDELRRMLNFEKAPELKI